MKVYHRISVRILFVGLLLTTPMVHADISVIVNPNNSLESLSNRDVTKLFLGRIKLYPGSGKSVVLVDQSHDHEDYQTFYSKVINFNLQRLKRYRAAYLFSGRGNLPLIKETPDAVKEYVSKNADAVGYIDSEHLDGSVKEVYRYP